jgi:hypothetical protein
MHDTARRSDGDNGVPANGTAPSGSRVRVNREPHDSQEER